MPEFIIVPRANGYAILRDGVQVLWCYDMKYAEVRLDMIKREEGLA